MQPNSHPFSLKPDLIDKVKIIQKDRKNWENSTIQRNPNVLKRSLVKPFGTVQSNFWIEGYGCSASFSDMEMIAGKLQNDGFTLADSPETADFNLIVTCSVKMPTEHKMSERIKHLSNLNKPLIIAGCLPAADESMVSTLSPKACLMGPNSIESVTEIAKSALNGIRLKRLSAEAYNKINLPKLKINPIISIIQISTGCLSDCTFCQTKLAKGTLKSFRIGDIVNQVKYDIDNGSKEIWLTSTDNGCYGFDLGTNILNLLKSCEMIDKYFKIRLGMMNPMYLGNMYKGIEEIYGSSQKLYKFIHIPIQSGSKKILKKMKRGRSIEPLLNMVERLKSAVPNITIATDIITGFPTETEEDFEETLAAILHMKPDIVNSSKFSPRPRTLAANMPKVSDEIISTRSEKIHQIIKQIAKENNSKWVGWKGEVLINDLENGIMKGRNDYYKSISFKDDPNFIFMKPLPSSKNQEGIRISSNSHINKSNVYSKNKVLSSNPYLGSRVIAKVVSHSNHTLQAIPLEIVK